MQYTLQNGTFTAAVDTKGGELVSFRDGAGTEYIWRGDPAYWAGRNPNLFPVVGGLRDGKVNIGGQAFSMNRHGFAREHEFTLTLQGEDFAVLELREDPDTLARYPFPFCLSMEHRLLPDGFSTAFTVSNPGDAPLPFCVGAHTAFNCPLYPGEQFEDYQLVFDCMEDSDSILIDSQGLLSPGPGLPMLRGTDTIPLRHEPFDKLDTLIFDGLRSKGVRLIHKDTGRGLRMEFQDFPMIAFWTPPHANAPFICLEPWHGCTALNNESGRFEDKPHCIILQPGESRTLTYTVKPL